MRVGSGPIRFFGEAGAARYAARDYWWRPGGQGRLPLRQGYRALYFTASGGGYRAGSSTGGYSANSSAGERRQGRHMQRG